MKPPAGTFWIGSDHPFDLHEAYLDFRADVLIEDLAVPTWLNLTADSRYRLWINGAFVARGPERCWPTAMAVDRIDVSRHLRPGVNAIAVQVYAPGYSHFAHVDRAAAGLIAWVEAGERVILRSDRAWRVRRDLSWDPLVPRVSIYGSGVERRDLARAEDWQTATVDDWAPARIVQTATGPIWAGLRPRATPLLAEERRRLAMPWRTFFGPTPASTGDPHADLRRALEDCPQGAVPDAMTAGQTAIWVFDLGHSQTCVAGAGITAAGGEVLTISHAEKLQAGDVLISDPATYCRMRPTDTTTLAPGRQQAEGFGLRGGRYVIFRLDAAGPVTPAPSFHVCLPSYPLAERALPDLGPEMNAVAAMCRCTLIACLQDGFVDSIWRESSQWLGDAVAQAFALQAISDDPRPLLFALDMAAEGAAPDGVLPSILPGDVPAYVVTDYNFSWVELLAMAATHPGVPDPAAMVSGHRATLRRMLARFGQDLGTDGLLRSQPGRRLFLDWSPMARDEPNLTYNLRYLHALRLAQNLDPEVAHDRAADALQGAILRTHADESGWRESPGGAPASALALSLLVLTGTLTGERARAAMQAVVARSLDPDDAPGPGKLILTSPFMHHYVFQALDLLGQRDAIRTIIAARWGRWARAGAPTTWENWAIDFPDGSACHGFSAHPLGWLLR